MPEFALILNLSTLNGTSGFEIRGEAGGGSTSGYSVSGAGDVNGDGFDDLIIGAPRADPNGDRSGSSYVVFGKAAGFAANLNLSALDGTTGFEIRGEADNRESGAAVSGAGDINGDGFDDLVVGSPNRSSGSGYGYSHVVFGKAAGFAANLNLSSLNGTNGFQISGEYGLDYFGISVSDAGDVNGDGFGDFIIGAPGPNFGNGASYVVFGKAAGFPATVSLLPPTRIPYLDGTTGFKIGGAKYSYSSGYSVSGAGDFNGDGFDDLIIGAPREDPNGPYSGASYVVFGKAAGFAANLNLSALNGANGFEISGEGTGHGSGACVSSAGDINGDGLADLIIGAPGAEPNGYDSGVSYVVFGKASGFAANLNLSTLNGKTGFEIRGEAVDNHFGPPVSSVSGAGDVNGDGFDDLIIGSFRASPNGSSSGSSYVVFGKGKGFAAALELSALNGNTGFQINGEAASDISGRSVSSAGDINSDGFDDIIIGAPNADATGDFSGASYVIFGHRASSAVIRIGTALSQTINGGKGNDRVDGQGGDDALFGWEGSDRLNGGAGRDTMSGGGGNDTYFVNEAGDKVIEDLGAGIDSVESSITRVLELGVDYLTLTGAAAIGGTGNILANAITGNGSANGLKGAGGNDTVSGGSGHDTLDGGAGKDTLDGGAGKNVFDYNALAESGPTLAKADLITGFRAGGALTFVDRIDLSTIDANSIPPGNQEFQFIGTAAFKLNDPGKVRFENRNGDTFVLLNTDKDVAAEAQIRLDGTYTLGASDFLV